MRENSKHPTALVCHDVLPLRPSSVGCSPVMASIDIILVSRGSSHLLVDLVFRCVIKEGLLDFSGWWR